MQSCERVIFFLSRRALESPNCFSEIRTAARLGKPILIVRLEDCEGEEDWRELLDGRDEIPLLESPEKRSAAILRSGFLPRRFHRKWTEKVSGHAMGLAASVLLFLAAAGALGMLAAGRWAPIQPEPPAVETSAAPTETPRPQVVDLGEAERFFAVSFPDALQESAIRAALGQKTGEIYRGQLADITELYLCGGLTAKGLNNVRFDADGVCRVNGAPVLFGPISDLRVLRYAVRLETLALIRQPLDDLSPLAGHVLLRELSLAGSDVGDLSALSELPSLEILHLEHTAVSDLRPLEAMTNLKTVTVSRDMLPLTWNHNASFSVILVQEP